MNYLKSIVLAVVLAFAPLAAIAQEAPAQCVSIEQFSVEVHKQDAKYDLVVLTGNALEVFAQNMDKITGGGHGPMDGIAFLNPEGNENPTTVLAIFQNHCYAGNAEVPTEFVKQALKGTDV